jgi:two-component sensor histidine kinase/tetratricopeptide (TPR) repeat protein
LTRNLCIGLVLGLLVGRSGALAEHLYPRLSPAAADSVRTLLRQGKPDTNRVNWLLQLGGDFLKKSPSHLIPGDLDSAGRYYREALALSQSLHYRKGQIRCGYLSGILASQRGNAEGGVSLVKQALTLSQQMGNLALEAEGWYYLGAAYELSPEGIPEKIRCYVQARKCYRQLGNREKEAYLLKCIADMHLLQGQYVEGYREVLEVLSLYRSIGYRKLHYTYDLLVVANQYLSNYPEAIRYGLASVESARATKDTAHINLFYRRLGLLHQELNQWEEGLHFLRKALANRRQAKDPVNVVLIAKLMVTNLLAQGKAREAFDFFTAVIKENPPVNEFSNLQAAVALADCHLALKQYPLAEKYFLRMMDIEKPIREKRPSKIDNYRRMGNFYLVTRQYGKARYYLDEALRLNTFKVTMKYTADIHLLLFRVDSAQGRYREAIAHHQRYKSLNDSIFNEKQSKQIASLQIQYKTREKEQNIALLTKQNEIQQARLKQQDFLQQVIVAGACMLLFLLGLGYNRYRLKLQSNRLLETKQREINEKNQRLQQVLGEKDHLLEEKEHLITHQDHILGEKDGLLREKEWLLREVHHRVKNNLQIVMSLLSSQAAYLEDEKALLAIQESQNRIHAISLSHHKLYLSEKIALIEMASYIREVVEYLHDSLQMHDQVRFHLSVEPIELNEALAVPLGLVINEAVTNALKYAFPEGRQGQVRIDLRQFDESGCLLTVADDGIGLGPDFDLGRSRSLGMNLMKGLSKQLDGSLEIESAHGLTIQVRFRHALADKSPAGLKRLTPERVNG